MFFVNRSDESPTKLHVPKRSRNELTIVNELDSNQILFIIAINIFDD